MNINEIRDNIIALAITIGVILYILLFVVTVVLLMHNGDDQGGPDIYNFMGLACLALLILIPKIKKWS